MKPEQDQVISKELFKSHLAQCRRSFPGRASELVWGDGWLESLIPPKAVHGRPAILCSQIIEEGEIRHTVRRA